MYLKIWKVMEINLLNRTGIHTESNHNFNDVDKSFIASSKQVLNNDFESEHKVDSSISVKRSDRWKIFFVCLFTTLIIGLSVYYKFFINQKIFVDFHKLHSLIQYVINDEDLRLLEFNFEKYSIDLKFEIDSDRGFPHELKAHAGSLMSSNRYKTEIVKYGNIQAVSISYPPFLEVVNSDFNEELDLAQYQTINQVSIDKKDLNNFLNNDFNINIPKIPNFKINRVGDAVYNLVFPE